MLIVLSIITLTVNADAIEELYLKPELRHDLSAKGREWVIDKFNLETCVDHLIGEFQKKRGG